MNTLSSILVLNFDALDAQSFVIAGVGYFIVFTALVLLFLIFNSIPKLLNIKFKKKEKSVGAPSQVEGSPEEGISGEVNAAISMALFMYFNELHDEESNVITIDNVSRRYSPWSSKIYGVRDHHAFNASKRSR